MEKTAIIDREIEFDESQLTAIKRCCDMQVRIVPITGAAGTGKTTIIKDVYKKLTTAEYSVALCAPTGKAAKRIQEATGLPAMTIHRLLEYPHPGERDAETGAALNATVPGRDKHNPILYQVVLADEYAMVNREMHRNLIDALPAGGRVCMFGDVNQLRPIEQGASANGRSPFEVVLDKFNGTILETIHRTEEGSGIALNGDRILRGMIPLRKDDFILAVTDKPVDRVIDAVMDALQQGINYGTNQGQIISTTKKSWIGTYKLNVALQEMLNPIGMHNRISLPRNTWDEKNSIRVGVGDKVIWTENAYDLRDDWDRYDKDTSEYLSTPPDKAIMNGESGVITDIDEYGQISIDVGDRVVEVPPVVTVLNRHNKLVQIDPRRSIDLGFVITTHKSQGSEWPHVIYVLNKTTMFMQSRHNMYTAISRARKTVTIVTDQRSLQNSVYQKMAAIERNNRK